ncbi:hypothetical protein [Streptomyces sp. NPDC058045]|uniref:hypothetical protein n=1 Tax=Streptomyces sp. NPDC058045 TaxID=3346311 RepID=UPI0036EEC839
MPISPHNRHASRAAVAALGAAGLIALAAAPAAVADETEPELVIGGIKPIDGVRPGSTLDLPVTVENKGSAPSEKVSISYGLTRGLDFAEVPSNCWTQHVPSYDEMPERWTAVCGFDQAVEPGAVYTPEKPLRVKALDRAFHDELRLRVGEVDLGPDENGTPPVKGTAPAVKLVESQAGGGKSGRVVDVPITSVNTADYQVTGAALKGRVGETLSMKVEFTNAGPAWFMAEVGKPTASVIVTPPAGTSVVKPPGFCRAKGGGVYDCGMSQRGLNEGGRETYTFKLKIDKRVAHAKGSVALTTEARPSDPDQANDKADITLDVTGAEPTGSTGSTTSGSGGSGGSTGGSGSSAGGSPGGSSSAGGDGTTVNGGNLAETGASVLPIAGVAAAAVVTGAGTLVLVRRRRARSLS